MSLPHIFFAFSASRAISLQILLDNARGCKRGRSVIVPRAFLLLEAMRVAVEVFPGHSTPSNKKLTHFRVWGNEV